MLLCVDIGNTNVVVSVVDDDKIINTYRFETNISLTEDEYYQKFVSFTANINVDGAIISNVVPALDLVFNDMFNKYYHIKPFIVGPGMKSGLKLRIENPKELGADLLCDAVGAVSKYKTPLVIVDLGTATKFIVVDGKDYLGGAIAPGIKGSLNSLIANAAKLSHTALEQPTKVISNSTTTCIQSGMIYGYASMIDGMIERIKEELNAESISVILTGGLSVLVKDVIKTKAYYEPNILIDGLIYLYKKNCM